MHELARELIGISPAIRNLDDDIRQASRSDAKILVTGESGVGKEVVARLIHRCSARAARPFVAMNCAGVPDSLLESELFGHVRGSFTGAYRDKPGLLEQAHGGTVFMDEVGEMSLRMQALLLRFLEDGDIYRVGSERRTATVNVRIVAATNRVLLDRIAEGAFREDLYYRLNVIHLMVPPLRERREDIRPLLEYFLRQFADKYALDVPVLNADLIESLESHDWPGNVRELRNVAERFIVRGRVSVPAKREVPVAQPVVSRTAISSLTAAAPRRAAAPGDQSRIAAQRLVDRILDERESFWSAVYTPFMSRDITRDDVRAVITAGLQHTRGNYKMLLELFNMEAGDYKRFLNFLRKHQCHVPFQQFRTGDMLRASTGRGELQPSVLA